MWTSSDRARLYNTKAGFDYSWNKLPKHNQGGNCNLTAQRVVSLVYTTAPGFLWGRQGSSRDLPAPSVSGQSCVSFSIKVAGYHRSYRYENITSKVSTHQVTLISNMLKSSSLIFVSPPREKTFSMWQIKNSGLTQTLTIPAFQSIS